jgi:hypothetical protein
MFGKVALGRISELLHFGSLRIEQGQVLHGTLAGGNFASGPRTLASSGASGACLFCSELGTGTCHVPSASMMSLDSHRK